MVTKLSPADTAPGEVCQREQRGASSPGVREAGQYRLPCWGGCRPAQVSAGSRGGGRAALSSDSTATFRGKPVSSSDAQQASGVRWSQQPGFLTPLQMRVSGSLFLGVRKSNAVFFKMPPVSLHPS